jgi:ABC-type oligopeptide transport system ATPase subunit
MKKTKNNTAATVITMLVIAMAILSFYFYWSYRAKPLEDTEVEDMTEVQKILNKDLEQYYPETSREVTKLFGSIMKNLYDNISDEEVEALALKARELYDEEFLAANPQEAYLANLYSDIASWKEENRRISAFHLINEDLEQQEQVDGVEYAITYLSFTIQESGKFTETWKMMLRQDGDKKWKILGWRVVPEEILAE